MGVRKPRLDIVGVGPGDPELVTPQAVAAIRSAEIVVGWELDLQPVAPWLKHQRVFRQTVKNYRRVIRHVARLARRTRQRVAVPRVGDPCISSGLKGLLELFHDFDISVISGVSSVQMAAALATINLDEAALFSFHDYGDQAQRADALVEAFRQGRHLVVLASPDLTPARMAQFLMDQGLPGQTQAVVCSNLTLPDEQVVKGSLSMVARRQFPWLTLSVVINPAVATEAEDRRQWVQWRRRTRQAANGLDS